MLEVGWAQAQCVDWWGWVLLAFMDLGSTVCIASLQHWFIYLFFIF